MKSIRTSLLALAISGPALAQTNPDQPTRDQNGDVVLVTASRSGDAVPLRELGASATIVDDDALRERQTRIVSDVLRDVPGVAVSRTGAVGSQTQVRIRGAEGNHTLVLIDGIKASDPYDGEYDFGTLLADEDAKIEVLRGQQSSLYGSDAIGGVINYITLTGAEAPGIRLRAEGGSNETFSGGARAAGVTGNLDYALSTSFLHTGGYPVAVGGSRDVGSDNLGASIKTIWTAAPNLRVTAVGRYSYTDADTDDSDNVFGSPTYGLTVDSPGVHFVNKGVYGLVRAQLDLLDDRWTNAVTGQVADTRRTGWDVANTSAAPAGQAVTKSSGDHGRRLKGSYESSFRFGGEEVQQRVTTALDVERESERTTRSPYGAFLGWRHTSNVGIVGEYELTAHRRLSFGGSVRYDDNSRFADDTTYRIQSSYSLETGTRLHAAYGTGVKAPSFSELFDFYEGRYIGNSSLKPERSKGYEAGVEQSLLDRAIVLDVTWFDNLLTDEITTVYDANFVAHPENLPGKTKQQGVEMSAAAQLPGGWRLDASFTHLHAPQDQDVTLDPATSSTGTFHGQAVRRPKNVASANLTWAPADKPFSGTVTLRYNGAQNDLFFGYYPPRLERLRSFTLVNLNASYRLLSHLELFGRIENLLDRDYQEVYSFETPGRAAYAGVRVRF